MVRTVNHSRAINYPCNVHIPATFNEVETMKHLLFIVGSLREASFNRQLAEEASRLVGDRATVEFLAYADLPFMNQDIEFPAPAPVERVRSSIMQADGLWIFSPEYNYSYPGALKNLIDWLSRPVVAGDRSTAAIAGKKVALSSAAGSSAGAGSRGMLSKLMVAVNANLMQEPQVGVKLNRSAFETDVLALSTEDRNALAAQADAFLAYLER